MEISIQVPIEADPVSVLGSSERNLKMIRDSLGVNITARRGLVNVRGERRAVSAARSVLEQLGNAARRRAPLSRQQVLEAIADQAARLEQAEAEPGAAGNVLPGGGAWLPGTLNVTSAGRSIRPKTANQELYLEAIRTHDLIFATGPAGTGKTYLAVAAAIHMLRADRARKLILVRPAVEAGERLGFLPGNLEEKVNPYLRPLFDALNDMMDFGTIRRFIESDVVEVVPLAFMRGRTLNNAIIILDEAQNTTSAQMKMFLTRMGQGSKMIVTGDMTQIDIEDPRDSGLIDAVRRLRRVPGVELVTLDKSDVVRHELVQRIVEAYGEDQEERRPAPLPAAVPVTVPAPEPPPTKEPQPAGR